MPTKIRIIGLTLVCMLGIYPATEGQNYSPGVGLFGCFDAPLMCSDEEIQGFVGLTLPNNAPFVCPPSFCGSCETTQWFQFVSDGNPFELIIEPNFCNGTPGGSGLQAMIFSTEDCFNFTPESSCYIQDRQV